MSTDEFKELWQKHDHKLEQNKLLNETIIKNLIYDRSNKKLTFLRGYEILNIVISGFICFFILMRIGELAQNTTLLFASIISVILGILGVWIYSKKLNLLNKIHTKNNTLYNSYNFLNKYKNLTIRERNLGLPAAVLLIICLMAIVLKLFRGINIFENLDFWSYKLIIGVIAGILFSLWGYSLIFKKINQIETDINDYEKVGD